MTVHKLSAGDGYTYLTRQVAAGDVPLPAGQSLAGYYTGAGNPPGVWVGAGAAGRGLSGAVSEAQMRALFAQGRRPDAERITAEQRAAGYDDGDVIAAARLGRPF